MKYLSRLLISLTFVAAASSALASEAPRSGDSVDDAITYAIHHNPAILRYMMKQDPSTVKDYLQRNPDQAHYLAKEYVGLIAIPHNTSELQPRPAAGLSDADNFHSYREASHANTSGSNMQLAIIPLDHPYGVMKHNESVSISDNPDQDNSKLVQPRKTIKHKDAKKTADLRGKAKNNPRSFEDAKKSKSTTYAKAKTTTNKTKDQNVASVSKKQKQNTSVASHKTHKPLQAEIIPTSQIIEVPASNTQNSDNAKRKNWAEPKVELPQVDSNQ